jgi:drug/metabolite transporter (DMT)-like permease
MQAANGGAGRWLAAAPAVFVLLWSTGFIGAKYGLPYVEPATFLLLRFALVVALLLPLALVWRAPWPRTPQQLGHLCVAGALVHGGYLGGVFAAIHEGMPAGLAALIVGLQPVLTALAAAPLLGEHTTLRQWLGLGLGFTGVALVVAARAGGGTLTGFSLAMAVVALGSITAGTLYQKRYCGAFDLRSGAVIQFVAASAVLAPFALAFEHAPVRWSGELVFALAWLVLVLSIGAISLLALLLRYGAATKVASLFYLVPPVTALIAFLAFGERLSPAAIAGFVLAASGVALVVRG